MTDAVPVTKWQDVACTKCGKLLTDPKDAAIQRDTKTGNLIGKHIVCPLPPVEAKAAPAPVVMTVQHLALLLTVGRILRARLPELTHPGMDAYLADDMAAIQEALAPFDPLPDSSQNIGADSTIKKETP